MTDLLPGFQTVCGSDIKRDGQYIELIELETGDEVAEAFCADRRQVKLSLYKSNLPPEVIAAFMARAKATLLSKAP